MRFHSLSLTAALRRSVWLRHPTATALRLAGASIVLLALGMMWASRIVFVGSTYVSGLGADGVITAVAFNISLGLVALGGVLTALGLWGLRSVHGILGAWTVSATLFGGSFMFAVSSIVHCSPGCPIPLTPTAGLQDLIHTGAAVVGFALAGVSILQTLGLGRAYAALALPSIFLVIVTSAVGGLLSLAGVATGLGGWLELVSTTAALFWLAAVAALTQQQVMTKNTLSRMDNPVPQNPANA